MLQVHALTKLFGGYPAVRGVSFRVERGEVLGFLGPNGAGKTTTMRMITGFLPPTSGTALINGHDILEDPIAAKKEFGYLPENAPVYADMNVWDYLGFMAEIRGFSGAERRRRIGTVLETCRLEAVRRQNIGTLSKGYKQRVCFAQALIHDPHVLIMDEPTDGLDPNQKHVVRTMIRDMAPDKVIVLSTHILEEVEAVCTRAIIISQGVIVANGSPAELKARSRWHGAVELALGKPVPDAESQLRALPAAAGVEVAGDSRYVVFPKDRAALLAEVVAAARQHGWTLASLATLEGRLDEVFRSLTTKPAQAAGEARAA
jgi:ABC-2 type transport system ATP-binding protein